MRCYAQQIVKLTGVATALAAMPGAASAHASGTFQVVAQVPLACWVDHSVEAEALSGSEGIVTEGCNNSGGYSVSVGHRPLSSSESARLHYGSAMVDLSDQPFQEVNREYGPTVQKVNYSFSSLSLNSPLTLTMTIQPL